MDYNFLRLLAPLQSTALPTELSAGLAEVKAVIMVNNAYFIKPTIDVFHERVRRKDEIVRVEG